MSKNSKNRNANRAEMSGDIAQEHKNDVMIGALEKDGEKMMQIIENGGMVAIVSGMEVMYTFVYNNQYQCFIHKFDAPDGRRKGWEMNERNRAMLKNLDSAADQLFEITFQPDMNLMGVMVAAERGIINFMDYLGILPAEDMDFMEWMNPAEAEENDGGN